MIKLKVGNKVWSINPQTNTATVGIILELKQYRDLSNSTKALVDFNNYQEWIAIELLTKTNERSPRRKRPKGSSQ
jgi:hypothetical protein